MPRPALSSLRTQNAKASQPQWLQHHSRLPFVKQPAPCLKVWENTQVYTKKTTIPEQQIPGTLQGGVQGLGSTTSLIQGPVIKVKRTHISPLYMQFMSWHYFTWCTQSIPDEHRTNKPLKDSCEFYKYWKRTWARHQPSEMQIGNDTHLHRLKPTAFKQSHHVHIC